MIEPIKDQIFIMIILAMVYILSAIAIAFGTQIYLAYRFYKNMYTDEGYLEIR